MSDEYICGGSKYMSHDGKVIHLPFTLDNLPEKIEVKEQKLLLQHGGQFHVSLFYIEQLIEKYNIQVPDFLNKVVNDFCEFTKKNDIDIIRYKNEYRFVQKSGKTTVVVMCEISNLNGFFDFVNDKYKLDIEYPVPHVTLYTLDGDTGTSLRDVDDIENYTELIGNPIGLLL